MKSERRRIVCNDDGWILNLLSAPVTADVLRERMVDTWADSTLDTLSWCVGNTSVQAYETKERIGLAEKGTHSEVFSGRVHENIYRLIGSDGGPLTVLTKQCHEAGFKLLPSLRMNSHYDTAATGSRLGEIRENNPAF